MKKSIGFILSLLSTVVGLWQCTEKESFLVNQEFTISSPSELPAIPLENPTLYWDHMRFTCIAGMPITNLVTINGANLKYYEDCLHLKIQNGDGLINLIGNAVVKIDGIPVVSPGDFDETPSMITKLICGKTDNFTIEILVRGKPGSYLDVWIEGILKPNFMRDDRDGNIYRTVSFCPNYVTPDPNDKTVWLAENLMYLPVVSHPMASSYTEPHYYVYDYYGSDVNEAKLTTNYTKYGVLYNRAAAMNGDIIEDPNSPYVIIQGVCPTGWHLPNFDEIQWVAEFLQQTYGGERLSNKIYPAWTEIASNLKSINDWTFPPVFNPFPDSDYGNAEKGTDDVGFSALPGGYSLLGFSPAGDVGCWWLSTDWLGGPTGQSDGYSLTSYFDALLLRPLNRSLGASVRCVKNYPLPEY